MTREAGGGRCIQQKMAPLKYRYFCSGVVLTSVSWAALIMVYMSHLESESKRGMTDEKKRLREELGLRPLRPVEKGKRGYRPFPHVNFDDKAAWEIPDDKADRDRRVGDRGVDKRMPGFRHSSDGRKKAVRRRKEGDRKIRRYERYRPEQQEEDWKLQDVREDEDNLDSERRQVPLPRHSLDLAQLAVVHNPEDQRKRNLGYSRFAFNLLISDRIGERRDIPDSRHPL